MPVPDGANAGRISKPNGLRGELNIILNLAIGKGIKSKDPLFIDIDGQRVPFFVEDVEYISNDRAIIKFEFIDTIEEARTICGCSVFLDQRLDPGSKVDQNDFNSVVAYKSYDQRMEFLGAVTEYLPNENNPVFIVDYHGKELIVPAVDEIIERINHKDQTIHFNLPEGLTEL